MAGGSRNAEGFTEPPAAVPKAVVVLRERAARDGIELALLQHVRESLAGYKCPRRLEIARALPRDGSGAIDRTALVVC